MRTTRITTRWYFSGGIAFRTAPPQKAKKVAYERAHTGFTREITVTVDEYA